MSLYIINPIKLWLQYYKSYECGQHVIIFKGVYYIVISKGGIHVHKHRKGGPTLSLIPKCGSHDNNYKRLAYIENPINVGYMF